MAEEIDSQSIKTTEAGGEFGSNGGTKATRRKQHILVDTQGHLLVPMVIPTDMSRAGVAYVLIPGRSRQSTWV
jgi:hypothetical protein